MYPIVVVREGVGLVAKANLDEKHEYLSHEIRYLKWLGYDRDIPRTISFVSEEAMAKYPHSSKFYCTLLFDLCSKTRAISVTIIFPP